MKITKHISFYYVPDRIVYVNNIINETNTYPYPTDMFIHTNRAELQASDFQPYTNGRIHIVYHDLSGIHPFYLTWKCRDLLKQQQDDYDIFMYIEDDILVPWKAIAYWLEYHEKLVARHYNLGFLRIEVEDNIEYITDLHGEPLDTVIDVDGTPYGVNNKNPYCAFWIYDKNEFTRFVNSPYYQIKNIPTYGIREQSAFGLHGKGMTWYKNTVIPVIRGKLCEDCKIYHMPNNYVTDKTSRFATVKFDEAIQLRPGPSFTPRRFTSRPRATMPLFLGTTKTKV